MSEPGDKRPTLKSLAEITGLGVSTVSQALRDSPEIAIETRRRVKLAAQQAGYRPNRAGVRLRTGKSNVITLVLNAEDGGSGFFAAIVYGISEALKGTNYHLVVAPYSLSDPMQPIRYIVETNSADGVIISRTQPDDPRVRYLVENNMPFATHGRTDMGIAHPYFDFDNEAFAFEAVRLLKARGRKRLVLVGPPAQLNYFHHTLNGFNRGLSDYGVNGSLIGNVDTDSPVTEIVAAARGLAELREPPDAIVCVSSSVALAMIAGLKQGGLEIGRDYDLVAKPVTQTLIASQPAVIAIEENFHVAGQQLARMVMASIAGAGLEGLQMIEAPTILHAPASTGMQPAAE